MFKEYETKQVIISAHQISIYDVVLKIEGNSYILETELSSDGFIAAIPPEIGDYIVYRTEDNYHCAREEFEKKYILVEPVAS